MTFSYGNLGYRELVLFFLVLHFIDAQDVQISKFEPSYLDWRGGTLLYIYGSGFPISPVVRIVERNNLLHFSQCLIVFVNTTFIACYTKPHHIDWRSDYSVLHGPPHDLEIWDGYRESGANLNQILVNPSASSSLAKGVARLTYKYHCVPNFYYCDETCLRYSFCGLGSDRTGVLNPTQICETNKRCSTERLMENEGCTDKVLDPCWSDKYEAGNLCSDNSCGKLRPNAECSVRPHCVCKVGYEGKPANNTDCTFITNSQCSEANCDNVHPHAQCLSHEGNTICRCRDGFGGNPLGDYPCYKLPSTSRGDGGDLGAPDDPPEDTVVSSGATTTKNPVVSSSATPIETPVVSSSATPTPVQSSGRGNGGGGKGGDSGGSNKGNEDIPLDTGAIAGIIIGVGLLIAFLIFVAIVIMRKRKRMAVEGVDEDIAIKYLKIEQSMTSVLFSYADAVERLVLERGVDVLLNLDNSGCGIIHYATIENDVVGLKLVTSLSPKAINLKDIHGNTSLSWASRLSRVEALRILLDTPGVLVNMGNSVGQTPLHHVCGGASNADSVVVVETLLKNGADPCMVDAQLTSPLMLACSHASSRLVTVLCNWGISLNLGPSLLDTVDEQGVTALMCSARAGDVESVCTLISSNCSLGEEEDNRGYTALHWAAAVDAADVILAFNASCSLRKHTLNVNHSSSVTGETPLHVACKKGHVESIIELLTLGASVDRCDIYDHPPSYYTEMYGHDGCTEILQHHSSKMDYLTPDSMVADVSPPSDSNSNTNIIDATSASDGHSTSSPEEHKERKPSSRIEYDRKYFDKVKKKKQSLKMNIAVLEAENNYLERRLTELTAEVFELNYALVPEGPPGTPMPDSLFSNDEFNNNDNKESSSSATSDVVNLV